MRRWVLEVNRYFNPDSSIKLARAIGRFCARCQRSELISGMRDETCSRGVARFGKSDLNAKAEVGLCRSALVGLRRQGTLESPVFCVTISLPAINTRKR